MSGIITTLGEIILAVSVTVTSALVLFVVAELIILSTTASIKKISQVVVLLDEQIKSLTNNVKDIRDEVDNHKHH